MFSHKQCLGYRVVVERMHFLLLLWYDAKLKILGTVLGYCLVVLLMFSVAGVTVR